MGRGVLLLSFLFVFSAARAGDAPKAAPPSFRPPSPEAIDKAIDRGVAWLEKAQHADGSWGSCSASGSYDGTRSGRQICYFTGPTSFALFTLAACGVKRTDPHVRLGLRWLEERNKGPGLPCASYEVSSRVLMRTELDRDDAKAKIARDRHEKGSRFKPPYSRFSFDDWQALGKDVRQLALHYQTTSGGFGYWKDTGPGYADVSATQFATLALRQASLAGYPVEQEDLQIWTGIAAYLRGLEDPTGAFPYHEKEKVSAGMTAAALSSLLICREQILLLGQTPPRWLDPAIRKAEQALGKDFVVRTNSSEDPERTCYLYCYLYAVERCGAISGKKVFGGKDWYLRGAAFLLREQAKNGRWKDTTCMAPQDVLGTCFALLFLKRSTPPCAVTIPTEK